jgi:hypothetical protein
VHKRHVILTCWHKHWFDFFQVQPLTFISHLHHPCPSLKRCGPGSESLLNASQTTWTPALPPTALALRSATSLDVERRERLPRSAPTLLSATTLDVERRGCLPQFATALAPSALPRHPMSSVEDASGLPPPSSLPRHLTLSAEDASPGLPLPSHPPLCRVTQHQALRMPQVCHCPPLSHVTSHLSFRTPATALSKAPQHLVTHRKQFYYYFSTFNSSFVYEPA